MPAFLLQAQNFLTWFRRARIDTLGQGVSVSDQAVLTVPMQNAEYLNQWLFVPSLIGDASQAVGPDGAGNNSGIRIVCPNNKTLEIVQISNANIFQVVVVLFNSAAPFTETGTFGRMIWGQTDENPTGGVALDEGFTVGLPSGNQVQLPTAPVSGPSLLFPSGTQNDLTVTLQPGQNLMCLNATPNTALQLCKIFVRERGV